MTKISRAKIREAMRREMTLIELVAAQSVKPVSGEADLSAVYIGNPTKPPRSFDRFLQPSGQIRTVETTGTAREPRSTPAPFTTGDVVTLKSGSFPMTVVGVFDQCDRTWDVVVVWSGYKDVQERTFPAVCLNALQDAGRAGLAELDDNIPF